MPRAAATSCLLCLLAACSDSELVGIHVRLDANGGGVITARALLEPQEPGPAEARTQGVTWKDRAALTSSQGAFAQISELQFGGIRFLGGMRRDEMPRLRITVPRGPDVVWAKALVPELAARQRAAKVYDPSLKTREIAGALRIEIQFPDTVISSGVEPRGRGVEAVHERNRAWLIIPVPTAQDKGDDLIWDVTWK
jgi:hypothetical protein